MKRTLIFAVSALIAGASCINAFDLKDALKGLKNNNGNGSSTADAITGALGNLLSTDKLEVSQLEGNWVYSAPAVTFASDNLLKKAGGAAASSVITGKLESIYKTAGLTSLSLNVASDGTFEMKVKKLTLKGTIVPIEKEGSQANFEFNFNAGSVKIGKMNAHVEKGLTGTMKVAFDVSKLITLIEKVSAFSGNSTLKTLSSTLSSYDGLCAGFELKKQ